MFESFTVIAKPHGLFLKEKEWPKQVQFTQLFIDSCDERFVRFTVNPWTIELKLENAKATYALTNSAFHDYDDLINGKLLKGEVVMNESVVT